MEQLGSVLGIFLFVAIHTGLRPFCELAKITADDVEQTERGMMWRVYASKTKKTRKIPVRPEVAELARRLIKTAPRGSGIPLLRNTRGKPLEVDQRHETASSRSRRSWDGIKMRSRPGILAIHAGIRSCTGCCRAIGPTASVARSRH